MEKQQHTPEPWLVETFMRPKGEVTQVAAFSEDGNRILCCVVESFKKIEDARLISAAPELLEALIMCCQSMSSVLPDFNPFDQAAYDKARAAIAKATGEQ